MIDWNLLEDRSGGVERAVAGGGVVGFPCELWVLGENQFHLYAPNGEPNICNFWVVFSRPWKIALRSKALLPLGAPSITWCVSVNPNSCVLSERSLIEKLWDLIQDQSANKLWPTIKRLDEVVVLHLKDWWEAPQKLIRLFGNGWVRLAGKRYMKSI